MSTNNPYDMDFDEVEEKYLQALEDFKGRLDSVLRPSTHVGPGLLPSGAKELRDRIEGIFEETRAQRTERHREKCRSDLKKFFPRASATYDEQDGLKVNHPDPSDIYTYVRAAYEAFGELLGEI